MGLCYNHPMKSQLIRQRNIPSVPVITASIRVKPTAFLWIIFFVGMIMVMMNIGAWSITGIIMVATSFMGLFLMPDARIIDYTSDYCILHNTKKGECKLIYWDEILNWQYKWGADADELIIEMMDHSVEKLQTFSKRTVVPYFRTYVADKEIRRGKHGKAKR